MPRLRVTGALRHAALVRRKAAERHAHLARSVRLARKGFATLAQYAHHLRQAGWPCKPPSARAVPKVSGPVIGKGSASARAVPIASLCQPPVGLLKIGGQRRAARAGALRGGTPLGAVALTRLRAHAQDRAARRLSRALQAEWPTKSAGPGSVRARAARVPRGEHAAKPERCSQVWDVRARLCACAARFWAPRLLRARMPTEIGGAGIGVAVALHRPRVDSVRATRKHGGEAGAPHPVALRDAAPHTFYVLVIPETGSRETGHGRPRVQMAGHACWRETRACAARRPSP